MTATTHAVVGTFIAARFTDPVLSLPIAFVSHYLLDIIPHWDSATNRRSKTEKRLKTEALIDGGIGIIVSALIYSYIFGLNNFFYLYLVVGVSVLPDLVTFFTRFVFRKKSSLWEWNNRLQVKLNQRMQLPWGILTQVAAVGIIYILLFTIFA